MVGREKAPSVPTEPDGLRPAAHNGVGREHVVGIQRARIIAAMVGVVAERGVSNVTVAHVVARSGVSRRTFYELFGDREECFLATFDEVVGRVAPVVVEAYGREERWRGRIRGGLIVLLEFLDEQPEMARLLVVESLSGGAGALERRGRVLAHLIAAVDEGRGESKATGVLPALTAEGLVGGALSVIHGRLVDARGGRLLDLASALTSMIVLPYLGQGVARREARQPVPKRTGRARKGPGNALGDLEMRLTYRTIRVLMAIAAHPGASNRRVADVADVSDQGQMSKLLARLVALELIENQGPGPVRGEPNSWRLTVRGQEIEDAIAQADLPLRSPLPTAPAALATSRD
jgi:AcrR family transcriptional regulator/DNA-binding MarR family transcriptional regulator